MEKEYVEIFVQGEHKRNSLPEIYHRKFSIISSRLPPTISFIEIKQVDKYKDNDNDNFNDEDI